MNNLFCIGIKYADDHFSVIRGDNFLIHGKGAHGRGHVATVTAIIYAGFLDQDLGKGIVHVRVGTAGRLNNAGLGEGGKPSTHSVQLSTIGIGASNRR